MRRILTILFFLPGIMAAQSNFSFSGYTANRTYTNNAYTFTNTQNGYTMSARVTQNANPGWMNLTGATSPNYATYAPSGCSSINGLFLASDRSSTAAAISLELSFSPAVCGPVTFRIFDINGEDVNVSLGYGFRDDVTVSAYDQNNTAIALSTSMVTNNGSGNCGGGSYGAAYTHTVGNALKVVGCTYDNCEWDYFTISSASKMIGRIVIDYASGNKDWYGTTISNPNRQWIIVTDVRAWTPALNITPNCGTNPIVLTGSVTSAFPPSTSTWGIPNASYPTVPSTNRPTAPTWNWTGTEGTFTPANTLTTNATGISSAGATITLTGQNNKGCVATRNFGLTIANCSMLPVELINFAGHCEDGRRIFNWSTASEWNNDRFELQQSEDAIHFTTIAQIAGAGNSQQLLNYEQITGADGGNYFRLKQIDHDGAYTFSSVIRVECAATGGLSIYPNPSANIFTVEASQFSGKTVEMVIRDVTGKTILHDDHTLNFSGDWTLDMTNFPAGVYHASFLDKQAQVMIAQKKIVKL